MLYTITVGLRNASRRRRLTRNLDKDKARVKDADPKSPRARVFLLAAHDHLREKR